MIEKGFLKTQQKKKKTATSRYVSIISNVILYLGLIVIAFAVFYLIVSWDKVESVTFLCVPFIIAGAFMIFISQLIKWNFRKQK